MNSTIHNLARLLAGAAVLAGLTFAHAAWAVIDGITGTVFNFTAKADHISTADGNSLYAWGYANDDGTGRMQYPGPTLIVNEGDTITINLRNQLPMPVSIVFPGHPGVLAAGGVPGMQTRDAPADNGATVVSYTFTATQPGTYLYNSGTHPSLQVEMGLVGAIVVRPAGGNAQNWAYNHQLTAFDHEYLFLLTEMDDKIHSKVEAQVLASQPISVDMTKYFPVLWFINGRNAPDTLAEPNHPLLPTQPYNCLPRIHPGEILLLRVVNAGRDMHPFHTHGNNFTLIARDGRMLSTGANGPDLGLSDFTLKTIPGETYEALFTWTGANLGWDYTGGNATLPVTLPNLQNVLIGTHWGGSPFLGQLGSLPPGGTTINPTGGYFFMWHSHNEKEITNNDIFPGGMMTMLIVEAAGVPIP